LSATPLSSLAGSLFFPASEVQAQLTTLTLEQGIFNYENL